MTKKECALCYGRGRVIVHTLPDLEKPITVGNVNCPKCSPPPQAKAIDYKAEHAKVSRRLGNLRRRHRHALREIDRLKRDLDREIVLHFKTQDQRDDALRRRDEAYRLGKTVFEDLERHRKLLGKAPDLSEQVRQKVSLWVPVSERLPPIGDPVLVYTPRSGRVTERMRLIPYEMSPDYYWGDRFGQAHTLSRFVTHWMPLPAPPDHIAPLSAQEPQA